jgi:hypothetical protein
VREGRPEEHVARATQLDLALVGLGAWRRPESPDQDKANALRVVRIRRYLDNVAVKHHDLSDLKLFRRSRSPEHEAIGLLFFAHTAQATRGPRARLTCPRPSTRATREPARDRDRVAGLTD